MDKRSDMGVGVGVITREHIAGLADKVGVITREHGSDMRDFVARYTLDSSAATRDADLPGFIPYGYTLVGRVSFHMGISLSAWFHSIWVYPGPGPLL